MMRIWLIFRIEDGVHADPATGKISDPMFKLAISVNYAVEVSSPPPFVFL